MKQIVPFTRTINFDTPVEEITSISLDKKINEIKDGIISGNFDLYLEYKENDMSVDTNKFSSQIPFDIDIDDRYVLDNAKVDIDDFYYELDDNKISLHIDVLIDNLELSDRQVERNEDDLFEEKEEKIEKVNVPIYETFDPSKETYVTYNVHIVRDDETLDTICQKYNVTKEDLGYYNDISTIKLGDKLIVPTYKK